MAKIKNAQQYAKRYHKRGERMAKKSSPKETGRYVTLVQIPKTNNLYTITSTDQRVKEFDHRMKPEHSKRVTNIGAAEMKFSNPKSMTVDERLSWNLEVTPQELERWNRKR